mmetsp:Transcript_39668/g.88781  ORF Transcript_39668/g.88781 Transcript_39668/m.88781 type:complete len:209 (+) Transcript_39668:1425-2051(+)
MRESALACSLANLAAWRFAVCSSMATPSMVRPIPLSDLEETEETERRNDPSFLSTQWATMDRSRPGDCRRAEMVSRRAIRRGVCNCGDVGDVGSAPPPAMKSTSTESRDRTREGWRANSRAPPPPPPPLADAPPLMRRHSSKRKGRSKPSRRMRTESPCWATEASTHVMVPGDHLPPLSRATTLAPTAASLLQRARRCEMALSRSDSG